MILYGYCEWMRRLAASGKTGWAMRHARVCPTCRAALDAHAAMDARLRGVPDLLPASPAPDDLWSRIESEIAAIDDAKRSGHRATWIAVGVAACSLALGFWYGGERRSSNPSLAQSPEAAPAIQKDASSPKSASPARTVKIHPVLKPRSAPKSAIAASQSSDKKRIVPDRRDATIRTPRLKRSPKIANQEKRSAESRAHAPSVQELRSNSRNADPRREIASLPKSSDHLSETNAPDDAIRLRIAESSSLAPEEKKSRYGNQTATDSDKKMKAEDPRTASRALSDAKAISAPMKAMRKKDAAPTMMKDASAPAGSANRQFAAAGKALSSAENPTIVGAPADKSKSVAPSDRSNFGGSIRSSEPNHALRKPEAFSARARSGGAGEAFGSLSESSSGRSQKRSETINSGSSPSDRGEKAIGLRQASDKEERRADDATAQAKHPPEASPAIRPKDQARKVESGENKGGSAKRAPENQRNAKIAALRIYRRGVAYLREGDERKARESFHQALNLDPRCEPARRALKAMTSR